jgi:hypothetical protein
LLALTAPWTVETSNPVVAHPGPSIQAMAIAIRGPMPIQ